ncbi:unnamed protein product [Bursaphelenchus okinawaensis]|uniref:Uncharacterized protein n=1 Tax=Bursaphelenchus okinawaensis TaxID=465554 RepID=A0A811JQ20_9BILA|nr:unnamed protein product [Bursaphelenchus okinawaensis]CAG9076969.1 unnamed protein product [Bursaphelenchus okinawaensis]
MLNGWLQRADSIRQSRPGSLKSCRSKKFGRDEGSDGVAQPCPEPTGMCAVEIGSGLTSGLESLANELLGQPQTPIQRFYGRFPELFRKKKRPIQSVK